MLGKTVLTLLEERKKRPLCLSFGSPSLDEAFGGIPIQGITEISGEAGSGKTQICLSLAIQAVVDPVRKTVPGYAAILSCGEGIFPMKRLLQMAKAYELSTGINSDQILSHISINECPNTDEALDSFFKTLPNMCYEKEHRVIIIDSLAGLLRYEYDVHEQKDMKDRTHYLFALSQQLKFLSETHKIPIVVVNQVTADFQSSDRRDQAIPALGISWSHCITTRFMVCKPPRNSSYQADEEAEHIREVDRTRGLAVNKENELNVPVVSGVAERQPKRKLSQVFAPTSPQGNGNSSHTIQSALSSSSLGKRQVRQLRLLFSPSRPPSTASFEICSEGLA